MWINKKKAALIIIQYHGKGKLKFSLPVSLYALLEVFDAFNDLRKLGNFIFPTWYKNTMRKVSTHLSSLPIDGMIELLYEFFNGLKDFRGLTLVEIDIAELYIKVAVY